MLQHFYPSQDKQGVIGVPNDKETPNPCAGFQALLPYFKCV